MYYKIQYDKAGSCKRITSAHKWRAGIGLFLLGVCVLAGLVWSANGDWSATVGAMENMANALERGSGITEAFSAFVLGS